MKNILKIIAFIFSISIFGQTKQTVDLQQTNAFEIKNITNNSFEIELSLGSLELKPITTEIGTFVQLNQSQLSKIYTVGSPNIPILSKLIEVPQDATVSFEIVLFNEQIISLSDYGFADKIVPAIRSQSKSEASVPYSINKNIYETNAYASSEIVKYINAGQLRAKRLGNLEIAPIQYNPVENKLRILNNLKIKVIFSGANHSKTEQLKNKYNLPFDTNQTGVLNKVSYAPAEFITQNPLHLVIVSDPMFQAQLAPFIAWKIKKGFKVTVGYTNTIGTTKEAIKTYLQNIYQGSSPMAYVLFVGDVAQIPAWTGNSDSHATDLRYCEYTNDDFPEVYYGRFSANNTAELQPQIDKTLMYEQYTMPNPAYLTESLLVAGDDATFEMTHGNGQIYYGDQNYFNATNNVTSTSYYQPLDNAAVSTAIVAKINSGAGFANYTAHCSNQGWAEPSFEINDVNGLTNANKYGFWIGNCCQSNTFNIDCFGEAALRKANGGAIGYIGGSNNTLWDEDFYWAVGNTPNIVAQPTYAGTTRGAFDAYWHTLANEVNNTSNWYITQSQMLVSGNLAVQASTSGSKQYYWEIYHLMGDPTLIPFIGTPQVNNVTLNPSALLMGMSSLQVSAMPYSQVALSQNGVLIASGFTNASGNVTLNFNAGLVSVGNANIVVTGQNRVPVNSIITVAPANQPFVVVNSSSTSNPLFDSVVTVNVALENVAASGSGYHANNVVATLSTTDAYVTLTDNSQPYGNINAATTIAQNNAFTFTVANNVPDDHIAVFQIVMTDNAGNSWNGTIQVTLKAPKLSVLTLSVDDTATNNNGILDPGETANIVIQSKNIGHADGTNVIATLVENSSFLTLNNATTSPTTLNINETKNFIFNVTANAATPLGTVVPLNYTLTAGSANQYSATNAFEVVLGYVPTYCDASGENTEDEFIQQVQFNTINNTSARGAGYTNYTNITTTVNRGQTIPITITNGEHWDGDKMGCWIDWNYDGDFTDANETITLTYVTGANSTGIGTGNVFVPANATLGNARLRVRVQYQGSAPVSCGETSYGEVEDYTLNVQEALGLDDFEKSIALYPNPTQGNFTLNLNGQFLNHTTALEIYNTIGQLIYNQKLTNETTTIPFNQTEGIYLVKITSNKQISTKKLIVKP